MTRNFAKNAILIATAFTLVEATPLPSFSSQAEAQNLLQQLFGGKRAKKRREEKARQQALLETKKKAKPIRIKSATFKTYKADKLVSVKLPQVIDPVTTASIVEGQNSTSTENATPAQLSPFEQALQDISSFNLKALQEVADALQAHYSSSPKFRWADENGVTDQAKAIIKALQNAELSGLPSENYQVQMPDLSAPYSEGETKWSRLMQFEMELSAAILSYVVDADRGLIDPNRISGYHDFARKSTSLDRVLGRMSYAADPQKTLEGYNPHGEHFKKLKSELAELLSADEKERITIADGTFLKPGSKSPELRNIVASIRLKGTEALKTEYAYELNTYRGDDVYTPELVTLVKAFQKENDLAADGIIGKKTIRAMVEDTNATKIEKVRYAMERARWLPHRLASKRVFINQPAYNVTYFEDNLAHTSMRVVVGKNRNQTNFFDDEIEKVEFNPSWGVPQSIIANEMLPKLRADPSYLDRLGYQVSYNGKSTSSSSINWSALSSVRPIGVRQPPGPKNALGELKILFPNKHAIYMHDTPAKSLFGRDTRAFSHGCVRLQHPKEMAAAVLGSNIDQIVGHIAPRKNKTVFLDKPIPVHVAYFTAWPNAETGEIEYFADVYGRDKALTKAFETTINSRVGVNG